MYPIYLRQNREKFWQNYWQEFGVDHQEFIDLKMYPIDIILKYINKNDKILECGCGGGRILRHLSKYGYNIEAIDSDRCILEELKKEDSSLKLSYGNILDLKFEDNHFNTTLCLGVISNLCDYNAISKAINELKRVTKDKGIIIISVPLKNIARTIQQILINLVNKKQAKEFYAWMHTYGGWNKYLGSFSLRIIEAREIVSRYNIFYWAKFLRSRHTTDLKLARVKDNEYRLNIAGEFFWFLHKKIFKKELANGITFVLQNKKYL